MAQRYSGKRHVYHAGGTRHKRRRSGPPVWLIVLLAAVALALCGAVLLLVLRAGASAANASTTTTTSAVASLPSLQPDEPPSRPPEPEPGPEPVEEEPRPTAEPEQEADPLELAFTEAELAQLDAMLDEWATAVTASLDGSVGEDGEDEDEEAGETEPDPFFTAENYGHNVSVYFKDLDSGLTYAYNVEQSYEIASLSKAPYAMYLYTLAGQGALDLDETIHVTAELLAASAENSGRLKDDETLPRDMSVEELIYEALRYSDTGALRILLARWPGSDYNAWATEYFPLNHPENVKTVTNGRITADDAAVYMEAIYGFMETSPYGPNLKEHLTNTRNLLVKSDYTVARKYGWDTYSLHDMAVVYAEHPYVIAICTDKSYGSWAEQAMFATITATIEDMVRQKYAGAQAAMAG